MKSIKESDRDPRERVARVTCYDCNGNWMAQVEEEARALVIDLAGNTRVELSQKNCAAIALWVAAAGVVAGKLVEDRTLSLKTEHICAPGMLCLRVSECG